jgi:threonine dehydratase
MSSLTESQIRSARELLARYFPPSRLIPAEALARVRQAPVLLKMESDLPTGSFKPRGALCALAANLARQNIREVTASSTGNHGAAVAYAARMLGVRATIFLPQNPNPVKRRRIADLVAEIIETGRDISDAVDAATNYAADEGAFLLDDASDPDLPAGPATIACEILERAPDVGSIYVPAGDTALIRGIAIAAKRVRPDIRIIGVQAEQAPSYYLSWKAAKPVPTETCDTIADGLATRRPLAQNVETIREFVDEMRLVSEAQMLAAIRFLLLQEHVVAEPAGAAATAAILAEETQPGAKTAVAIVSGANISESVLRAAIAS